MTNLNKYIASSGVCSRRSADILIKDKKVKINNNIAKTVDKVGPDDIVTIDGKIIKPVNKKIYLAFNKPVGVICTTGEKSHNTIMDYIKIPERVFPVGRLDVKSEGLILLTNDGELTQEILKSKKVEKEYLVSINNNLTEGFINKLIQGVNLDGRYTLPAKVTKINNNTFKIVLLEGRKRQIRRMCEKFHYEVIKLTRIRIGKITLEKIPSGKYIEIDPKKVVE